MPHRVSHTLECKTTSLLLVLVVLVLLLVVVVVVGEQRREGARNTANMAFSSHFGVENSNKFFFISFEVVSVVRCH